MKTTWMFVLIALLSVSQKDDLKPGLLAEFYDIGEQFDDFPALDTRSPALRRIDREIRVPRTSKEWPGTRLIDYFCIRWTGVLRVPREGKYRFFLESDDGSRLFIDGKLVVNNGGLHGLEEETGEVQLKGGDHVLKVDFFECGGEASCTLSWDAGGGRKEPLPASVLLHNKDKDLDK